MLKNALPEMKIKSTLEIYDTYSNMTHSISKTFLLSYLSDYTVHVLFFLAKMTKNLKTFGTS